MRFSTVRLWLCFSHRHGLGALPPYLSFDSIAGNDLLSIDYVPTCIVYMGALQASSQQGLLPQEYFLPVIRLSSPVSESRTLVVATACGVAGLAPSTRPAARLERPLQHPVSQP